MADLSLVLPILCEDEWQLRSFLPFSFICCLFVCISLRVHIEDNVHFKCGVRVYFLCFLFVVFVFLLLYFLLYFVLDFVSIYVFCFCLAIVTTYPSAGGRCKAHGGVFQGRKTRRVATNVYSGKTLEKPKCVVYELYV